MVPLHRTAAFLSWLLAAAIILPAVAAQDPQAKVNYFHHLPARLFFLDDTEVAIYHDAIEGNVYVSSDEGKSWDTASDVPKGKANMVLEHPFDNKYAFILTKGKTHYRTEDRGRSWKPFDVPVGMAYVPKPLSFHSDPKKFGYILFQGTVCDRAGWGSVCHDETYYTKDAFSSTPKLLRSETTRCQFAHSSKDFRHDAHQDLIYCVAFDTSSVNGGHSIASSRLYSSTDYFVKEKVEDLGIGKNAKGVLALAIVSKYAVVALNDLSRGNDGEMLLYVSIDTEKWGKAQFPQSSSAKLRQNAYTIVESTTHSLAVDVKLQEMSSIGTLFVSNSNGTYFVESLKDTNRNELGFVDFENLYGVEGVGLSNVVKNAQEVEGRNAAKQLRTMITFDDGSSWSTVRAPFTDADGNRVKCDPVDADTCSLHLHSVTSPHNFGRVFSSPAPGLVMAVGSVGEYLKPYDDCDTFLSTDAGLSWKMVRRDAHKYEFGDSGSIIVVINDEEGVDTVRYSTDFGKSWKEWNFGVKLLAKGLTTLPDSTSQKFVLLGQISRADEKNGQGRFVVVHLDFAKTRSRKCGASDFEDWYARTSKGKECLMGHKQWYKRRKADADCYVGEKFADPVEHENNCVCSDDDYECDYNYVRSGNNCVPVGPEPIPAGVCTGRADQKYKGSSGFRLIPGNTCIKKDGVVKDEPVEKSCSQAKPEEGQVTHQAYTFPSQIVQESYFKESTAILVRLGDHSIWQSSSEGYHWDQLFPKEKFLAFYMHSYTPDRAYLITSGTTFYYTSDAGRNWNTLQAPNPPNTFGGQVLQFHPQSDYLIWTGNSDCGAMGRGEKCRAESYYTRDNGRRWNLVEKYVRNCAWARDDELKVDPTQIICESYRDKKGSQTYFQTDNPLQLVGGTKFFEKKTTLFNQVVGFAKFSEFLIVAEFLPAKGALDLQVSLDGRNWATGKFPPSMHPETHAYTVLESSTKSVFLHMTMSDKRGAQWGNILKSNSNGTYFGLSIDNVNRDDRGYVDFEKMIGLDGIALINIVTNTEDAINAKFKKDLQTRITHNDGSTWKSLVPPKLDSLGRKYECASTKCALHVHGYTERFDSRATYSSPSVVGLLLAVGNVGEHLAPYKDSDTFLSRDAGFTWEEVHKDAHLFEFGDSGSVLVMVNDEEPVDYVLFSTDEGLNWKEYKFGDKKMRVKSIVTVPSDTSRKFILMGFYGGDPASVVVQLDFSSLTSKRCQLSLDDPGHDDFELWSPSEERSERCLFGRQTLYHRRVRDVQCMVGDQPKAAAKVVKNCACTRSDFECEFNHMKNEKDECVLLAGLTPLPDDDSCRNGEEYWYERTAYRLIPFSSCEDGVRPDRGLQHACPGIKSHGFFFWLFMLAIPFGFTAMVASWYIKRSGLTRGSIRLPGDTRSFNGDSGIVATLVSIPWFIIGVAGVAYEYVANVVDELWTNMSGRRGRGGYRAVDEDAQILRFEDDD